jgi:predicted negative regulator of RcsB-dependent stress response
VDRLTRKELKTDKFALEVGHTVDWAAEHRKQLVLYGSVVAALIVVAVAVYAFLQYRNGVREQALRAALRLQDATVGGTPSEGSVNFPTEQAKSAAVTKAFEQIANDYSGSQQAAIANYYLGTNAADRGELAAAEKYLRKTAESGYDRYASLAKLSLASVLHAEGKTAEGEKLLRDLVQHPTEFVSKDQATIALARYLAPTNPAEARKLLEPLRTERSTVSRAALSALADIGPAKK